MKKILLIVGKVVMFIILGVLALFLLTVIGLNVAKHFIYSEYYSIKTNICKNPGLNDGFVCQGIAISEENGVILTEKTVSMAVNDFTEGDYKIMFPNND
jgi:hypothetical protein